MDFKIEEIDGSSLHFREVLRLGYSNRKSLGFLPEGAFREYAQERSILVAVEPSGCFAGYLLYRISKREITLVHLCVRDDYRRLGAAQALVQHLKGITKSFPGIGLWCRRDYLEACKVWEKLGFIPVAERNGRSQDGSVLEKWWFDHGHESLFSLAAKERHQSKLPVVIDSCVFFAMHDSCDTGHDEANALKADWLTDAIELYITDEVHLDIHRCPEARQRQQQRARVFSFLLPQADQDDEPISECLKVLFPEKSSQSDLSDLRHLAKTIAYGARYFVTWDKDMLGIGDNLFEVYGLRVLTPTDLIIRLDELRREDEYQPARVAGTYTISQRRVASGKEDQLAKHFVCHTESEKKSSFLKRLRGLLQKPQVCVCYVVEKKGDDDPVALMGYSTSASNELEVVLLRVSDTRLAPTLVRYLISQAVFDAVRKRLCFISITERYQSDLISGAAEEAGFLSPDDRWIKITLERTGTATQVCEELRTLAQGHSRYREICRRLGSEILKSKEADDVATLSELEHLMWPTKILDAGIPSFIVPIKPFWAQHLFDEGLASQDLFGAQEDLALNRESVYYRSRKNAGTLQAPSRILWYVSTDPSIYGSGRIRACSRLNEIVVDDPKLVFRRFKRLGIYDWGKVSEIAERDEKKQVMALRFDDTELLPNPLVWDKLGDILRDEGCYSTLQSPRAITPGAFQKIHNLCMEET